MQMRQIMEKSQNGWNMLKDEQDINIIEKYDKIGKKYMYGFIGRKANKKLQKVEILCIWLIFVLVISCSIALMCFRVSSCLLAWQCHFRSNAVHADYSRRRSAVKRIPSAISSIHDGIFSRSTTVLLSNSFAHERRHPYRGYDYCSYGVDAFHVYASCL